MGNVIKHRWNDPAKKVRCMICGAGRTKKNDDARCQGPFLLTKPTSVPQNSTEIIEKE